MRVRHLYGSPWLRPPACRIDPAIVLILVALLLAATPGRVRSAPSPAAEAFRQAHRDAAANDRQAARAGFETSIDTLPLLEDHALFFAARLAAKDDDTTVARRHLERLLAQHSGSIWRGEAFVLRGELALDAGENAAALEDFNAALSYADQPSRIPARLGRVHALVALGRAAEAWPIALELADAEGEEGKTALALREKLAATGAAALGVSQTEFALGLGRARLASGDPRGAREVLAPLVTATTPGRQRGEAELLSAAAARAQGEHAAGEKLRSGLIARGKPAELAGNALYARARTAWNLNEDSVAKQDYELLLTRFPGHARSAEARHALARIAEANGELPRAAARYDEILKLHPDSRLAETAAWRRGFAHYLDGDPALAAGAWHALGDDEAGLYWRSRALAGMNRDTVSRAVAARLLEKSPTSYYVWWVRVTEGSTANTTRSLSPAAGKPPQAAAPTSVTARLHLDRARLLGELALPESAERELDAIRRETGSTRFLMQEYARIGSWGRSIRIARLLESRGEQGLAKNIHPLAHREAFQRAGTRHQIDPLLLASLSRRESLFEERARSPVGAYGLMQLMAATAAATAGRRVTREELGVAATNIDLGARYLRELLDKFDGRIIPALAAYNGGPAAVARWQAANGARPGDEFVELITYRETRRYVKAVLENYRIYRALYGGGAPNPKLY